MNEKIPDLLLYIFFALTTVVTVFRFVRTYVLTKELGSLRPGRLASSWQPLALSIAPVSALLYASNLAGVDLGKTVPSFAGAATLMWLLSQIGLSGEIRSLLLLMAAVGLGLYLPADNLLSLVAAMAGLVIYKLVENLLHKPESRLDDLTAPFVWLTTAYWARALGAQPEHVALSQSLVLATLTASVLIRWAQPILLPNDTIYLKRLMLSATGALAFLILVTKVIMHSELGTTIALAGGGFLVTYLLQSLDKNPDDVPPLPCAMKNILLVGIATLAATRLFGMQGLLILAAASIIAPQPGSALIAGLFWSSRVLLQTYVSQFNPNVSGVNLLHSYVTAALYAGFLAIILASLLIKEQKDRRLVASVLLSAAVILAVGANYFLHSEPTASLLIALSTSAVLAAYLAPALYPQRAADQENLLLLPALACASALISSGYIDLGNEAGLHSRIVALCVAAGLVLLLALVNQHFFSAKKSKPSAPAPDAA